MNENVSRQDAAETSRSPDSSVESVPDSEFDKLIELQTRRSDLIKKRDLLLRKKLDLQEDKMRLNERLASYKGQKLQLEAKKKLEFFLHQNDHEISKLSAPDRAASFVLENLDVFSSPDWISRGKIIGRFYPNMSITNFATKIAFENGARSHSIEFTMEGYGMPLLEIFVEVTDETVTGLSISNWTSVSSLLHQISPTFQEYLESGYLRQLKLDMLFYSYNCLSRVQHQKISVFWMIIKQYLSFICNFSTSVKLDLECLKYLMHQQYIELAIDKFEKTFLVRLEWTPILQDYNLGEIQSDICFTIFTSELKIIGNAREVFIRLAKEYGVSKAFNLMIFNLFEIETAL